MILIRHRFLHEQHAVPRVLFQLHAVRGEVGEPLPVSDVAKAVFTGLEVDLSAPPAVAFVAHGDGLVVPGGEVTGDGDGRGIGPEEPELDDSVCPDACHGLTPFVMMQYKVRATAARTVDCLRCESSCTRATFRRIPDEIGVS